MGGSNIKLIFTRYESNFMDINQFFTITTTLNLRNIKLLGIKVSSSFKSDFSYPCLHFLLGWVKPSLVKESVPSWIMSRGLGKIKPNPVMSSRPS